MQKRHFRAIILTGGLLLVVVLIATKCSVSIFLATERPGTENAASERLGAEDSPVERPVTKYSTSESSANWDTAPDSPSRENSKREKRGGGQTAPVKGCTDTLAENFDSDAIVNDGSCTYPPVTISLEESHHLPKGHEDTSGIIYWNGRFWLINDSGPRNMYGLQFDDPKNIEKVPLGRVPKRDWEEIAQDETHIYIGDFGNNYGSRDNLRILKFTKESILAGKPQMEVINFRYSDQHDLTSPGSNRTDFDCEAFLVRGDSIFLFTKQWASEKTSVYLLPNEPGDHVAQLQQTYDVQGLVTGSVYLEDMDLLVFTGYSSDMAPFLYLFYDFEGVDFFGGNRRNVGLNLPGNFLGRGHQVEAVTTRDGLTYYITNEHFSISVLSFPQQIHRLDLSGILGHYVASRTDSSH
jgi:hypothetical protein